MTYAEAFDKIKKKLAKIDTTKMQDDYAIQITITDEDAKGTFYVSYIGGQFSVEPYDYRDNSVSIDISVDDFIKIITGKLSKDKAVENDKLTFFGNVDAVDNIFGIVKPATRKTTAKKTAPAKKETAPKNPAAAKTETKTKTAPKKTAAKSSK